MGEPAQCGTLGGIKRHQRAGEAICPRCRRARRHWVASYYYGEKARGLELTDRERDVLDLLARGMSDAEIAHTLHVACGTVKSRLRRLAAKVGGRNRVEVLLRSGALVPRPLTPAAHLEAAAAGHHRTHPDGLAAPGCQVCRALTVVAASLNAVRTAEPSVVREVR